MWRISYKTDVNGLAIEVLEALIFLYTSNLSIVVNHLLPSHVYIIQLPINLSST